MLNQNTQYAKQFANLEQRDVILFDLDGTLVDSAKDIYRAMNLTLADLGRPSVKEEQIRIWIGRGASQLCECVLKHQDGEVNSQQHQIVFDKFVATYEQNICVDTALYAGVAEFLQYCQQHGKKMAVVTNKPYQATINLLNELNLMDYFALVLGGDSLPERKPSPLPLLHSLEKLNCTAERALMIGDSRNDVESARSAGIDCVALTYGYNHGEPLADCQPQCVIDNLNVLI
ncbi:MULTISPECIES: phosphoglycolate phosphatase [unclassified Acinetobacter]|uniref:phosphoglycolate phosphatase n=1 Tax=unclassified Acinetobacter TaxID=196816 RepID=UPI0035BA69AB